MMDDLLGKIDENGVPTVWPKLNVMGGTYSQPANRQMVSGGQFVVIPAGFTAWERIDEIKAALSTSLPKTKAKAGEA